MPADALDIACFPIVVGLVGIALCLCGLGAHRHASLHTARAPVLSNKGELLYKGEEEGEKIGTDKCA